MRRRPEPGQRRDIRDANLAAGKRDLDRRSCRCRAEDRKQGRSKYGAKRPKGGAAAAGAGAKGGAKGKK